MNFLAVISLQDTYEQRRKDYMGELQKREDDMRSSFIRKVKSKEAELKQEEQEVSAVWLQRWIDNHFGYLCITSATMQCPLSGGFFWTSQICTIA